MQRVRFAVIESVWNVNDFDYSVTKRKTRFSNFQMS
jgi:hypothetical protein